VLSRLVQGHQSIIQHAAISGEESSKPGLLWAERAEELFVNRVQERKTPTSHEYFLCTLRPMGSQWALGDLPVQLFWVEDLLELHDPSLPREADGVLCG